MLFRSPMRTNEVEEDTTGVYMGPPGNEEKILGKSAAFVEVYNDLKRLHVSMERNDLECY